MASKFINVERAPPDAIFGLVAKFKEDNDPNKINLSIGAYRTDDGTPWVLPVVKTIEAQMGTDAMLNHEYLPLDGLKAFTEAATRLVLGSDSQAITQNRYCAYQALSGTGSLRVGVEFLKRFLGTDTICISKPTWSNHRGIARDTGFSNIIEYRYYDPNTRLLAYQSLIEDLKNVPRRSIIVLHTCAHNPTGVDPTREQWSVIMDVLKERDLFPLMDSAYIGFASGDIDQDSWPIREMVRRGIELFIAQSFSKNFGLYNERVGQLCCVFNSPDVASAVLSQITVLGRTMWSNCPNHGARIVATALNNPTLYQEWIDNLTTMTDRIKAMREGLYTRLKAKGTPGTWEHITSHIGMFTFSGLTTEQVDYMRRKYHVYLLSNGRINMCGLTTSNIDYVVDAIDDAIRNTK